MKINMIINTKTNTKCSTMLHIRLSHKLNAFKHKCEICYLYGWTNRCVWNPTEMILYRYNMTLNANRIKARCAMTLIMENIASDISKTRPIIKMAPDNFGFCHIKISPTEKQWIQKPATNTSPMLLGIIKFKQKCNVSDHCWHARF